MCYNMIWIEQGSDSIIIITNGRKLSFMKLNQFSASLSPEGTEPGSVLESDCQHKPTLLSNQNIMMHNQANDGNQA